MELDEPPCAPVGGDVLADRLGDVGLSGTGWPVEHELTLLLQETEGVLQPREWQKQFLGERGGRRGEGRAGRRPRYAVIPFALVARMLLDARNAGLETLERLSILARPLLRRVVLDDGVG